MPIGVPFFHALKSEPRQSWSGQRAVKIFGFRHFDALNAVFWHICVAKVVPNDAKLRPNDAKVVQKYAKLVPNDAIFRLFLPQRNNFEL